ncbi:DMT family transporter [Gammaproteobacteria bacterium]|nr:DMT family transporter [Gammaproteobacteria bacterium]
MQINRCYLIHGFLPAFFSACCFAVMAVCIKIASSELPAPQLVFLRSVVGLLIILPIVLPRGVNFIKTPIIHLHMLRGFISLCAMICFFYAISQLGLSESTLLNASSPLFIGLLALPILKEKITSNNVIALIIGFIGICFIIKPGTTLFTLAALIGLCSGLFIACAKILIRYMASTEPVMRTVFYFSIFSTLYSSVLMIWFWQSPTMFDILIIVIAAICATGGQTLLTYSYTHNDAVTVAPFTYVTVIMTTLLGWLGWNELPDTVSSIGAILIIGSCTSLIIQSKSSNT